MLEIAKRINEIASGWKNYVWESEWVRLMAKRRAVECGKCDHAKEMDVLDFVGDDVKEIKGMACELCSCPLSAKLRSPESKCDINKW